MYNYFMVNINSKTFFINLILFIFLFGCGSSSDITKRNFDKVTQSINDCVQQSPDEGVNRYSISDSGIPLKNGEPYVFNSKDIAEEIFKISLSEGYDLGGANQICVESFVRRGENEKVDLCLRNLERMPNSNNYNKDWPTTDGYYEFCYQNGNIYQRFSIRDKRIDGGFEEYWENGTLRFRKFYSVGIKLDKELSVYRNGLVEFKQTDSDTYESYYENGQMSLESNNKFTRGYFENGELESYEPVNGDYEKFYENGQLKEKGTYKKNKRVGKVYAFHPNGKIRWEREYNKKSNLIDGEYNSFHSDGVKSASYTILNGEVHGLVYEYLKAFEYQVYDVTSGRGITFHLYNANWEGVDDSHKPLHSSIKPGSSYNVYVNGNYCYDSTINKNIKNSIRTNRYAFVEKSRYPNSPPTINYRDMRCESTNEQIKEMSIRFPILSDEDFTTNAFVNKYSCYDQGTLVRWTYNKERYDYIKKECE